ncbi:MAG: hypothetical protein A3H67_01360 [Candidatus Buchananbacteria bacterium RIFCSPLOWO2_02_FULL_46_11b]|uniref:Uncharacterized protein n=1 Tax=Candidatus Buchananbacteria bacterium RIFCSPLOWO2_02_FULL_46_11b TaxID=1797548 RepID=A0A1G1Z111_9BACT|nr:MAG: hypothetical protein A3H67_01360 [Candidatus Buchananbacteria bacterium RIFCSPLOWO2_02_FULL_46_11b]
MKGELMAERQAGRLGGGAGRGVKRLGRETARFDERSEARGEGLQNKQKRLAFPQGVFGFRVLDLTSTRVS